MPAVTVEPLRASLLPRPGLLAALGPGIVWLYALLAVAHVRELLR